MKHDFKFLADLSVSGIEMTDWQRRKFVNDLPSPLYWVRPTRRIMWNVKLIQHLYLVCNGDRNHPEHQKMVELYLATLPKMA